MRRVLKKDSIVVINFPIYLHGHKYFVRGVFESIVKVFLEFGLKNYKKTAVSSFTLNSYKVWRRCRCPENCINSSRNFESTSHLVEY